MGPINILEVHLANIAPRATQAVPTAESQPPPSVQLRSNDHKRQSRVQYRRPAGIEGGLKVATSPAAAQRRPVPSYIYPQQSGIAGTSALRRRLPWRSSGFGLWSG